MNLVSVQDLIEAGRQVSLTGSALAEQAKKGTPKQREYLYGLLVAGVEGLEGFRLFFRPFPRGSRA
ncbi:hypothetical protein GCM10023166_26820 [Paeniglutamicibacter cryotolerans]|uniref:Uncharacterized protein n=1 Tax=Paeniglutamicibacter cryotolerans TaxID=670079 RepID=A0A839QTL3_9MICC|nr:hypothetical protein [Paeniglutamicibacter cryotolerans]